MCPETPCWARQHSQTQDPEWLASPPASTLRSARTVERKDQELAQGGRPREQDLPLKDEQCLRAPPLDAAVLSTFRRGARLRLGPLVPAASRLLAESGR